MKGIHFLARGSCKLAVTLLLLTCLSLRPLYDIAPAFM